MKERKEGRKEGRRDGRKEGKKKVTTRNQWFSGKAMESSLRSE